jgi:hypothetical protein
MASQSKPAVLAALLVAAWPAQLRGMQQQESRVAAQASEAPKLDATLRDRMAAAPEDAFLPVWFALSDRLPDTHWFPRVQNLPLQQRRATVMAELKAHAQETQRALRSLHAMFARGVKQKDGKRMDQGGLFPFATSWMFSSIAQVYEGRLMMDHGMSLRDVPQKLGVYAFVERFTAQVQKNTAARLEHGILALLHCQRERRSLGEEDDGDLESRTLGSRSGGG